MMYYWFMGLQSLVLSLHSGLDEFFLSDDKIVIVPKIHDDSLIILNFLWDQS